MLGFQISCLIIASQNFYFISWTFSHFEICRISNNLQADILQNILIHTSLDMYPSPPNTLRTQTSGFLFLTTGNLREINIVHTFIERSEKVIYHKCECPSSFFGILIVNFIMKKRMYKQLSHKKIVLKVF